MLSTYLKTHHLILASGSPRRQQFLKDLDLSFEIRVKPINEVYPNHLKGAEISDYLAVLKATAFKEELHPNDILITSDTIVWHNDKALGKPKDENDAFNMLSRLSGTTHEVITSVGFTTCTEQRVVNDTTKVSFKKLTDAEINYYITNFKPYDKAGAYGIQEWIGYIGVERIEGSYFTVMGLPLHLVYETLMTMAD
ncbi:Maf-like protein [Flavobacteriaceae bacterium M23B6Z8]